MPSTIWSCIPCYIRSHEYPDDEFHIFFVDLSQSGEYLESVPRLRVSRKFKFSCFLVKESTLYMFSSTKKVGTLKLSEQYLRRGSSHVLEEPMIEYKTSMHYRKRFPLAVHMPDGRFLVYSSIIQSELLGVEEGVERGDDENYSIWGPKRDFEIYDTVKDEWKELPPIQPFYDSFHQTCLVDWAVFKDQQTLLVHFVDRSLQFELDINNEIWTRSKKSFGRAHQELGDINAVVNDEIVFTPYQVFDIKHGRESDLIPSSFEDYNIYERDLRSGLVSVSGGGRCCFYIVQGTSLMNESTSKISIRTYSLDIDKYNRGNRENERKELELRNKIKKLVHSNMPQEKMKLVISLLGQKLPPIDVKLINSSQFVADSCNFLMPMCTLSLFWVSSFPASRKQKQV